MRGCKVDMGKSFDEMGLVMREAVWGDMHVGIEIFRETFDVTPLHKGCPDDRCQCPHWGYVTQGRVTVIYTDHEETICAGDAYYMSPGHHAVYDAGTETVEFSPNDSFNETMECVSRNLEALSVGGGVPRVDAESEYSAIHKFHDECMTALRAGNVDCFAEDGQMLPRGAAPIKGRAAIGEVLSQLIKDPNFSVSHDIVSAEISRSNDLAYIHYTYEIIMSDPDGNPVTERGKAVYVLTKQSQDGWNILIDIWNTDAEVASDTVLETGR